MEQQLKSILIAAANDTLEKLAFVFAFPDDGQVDDSPGPAVVGRVDFNGHFSGSSVMQISTVAIPELAGNMLGLDDDDEICEADQHDALKEILNVICGNVLPSFAGDHVEFNIMAPAIIPIEDVAKMKKQYKPACTARLMLEEGVCDLIFFIQEALTDLNLNENTNPKN